MDERTKETEWAYKGIAKMDPPHGHTHAPEQEGATATRKEAHPASFGARDQEEAREKAQKAGRRED